MKELFLFLLMLYSISGFGQNKNQGVIKVTVEGLRNNTGQVGIRIFDEEEGFPSDREKAVKEIFVKPINGQAGFEISGWDFGIYAIGAIHDENSNKEFDKNFFGIPSEGFGTSNNPKITFGPPSFKQASFNFNQSTLSLNIKMVYF